MNTNGRDFIVFLLLSITFFASTDAVAKKSSDVPPSVTIELDDWSPYIDRDAPFNGSLPHIVTAAYKLQGVDTRYQFVDWKVAYENVKKGTTPISIGWVKDASRENEMHFSAPISHITLSFFHRKNMQFTWQSLKDLEGYRFGYVKGFSYGDQFNNALLKGDISAIEYETTSAAFMALLHREVDLLPSDTNVGQSILSGIETTKFGEIVMDEHPLLETPVHMIASKKNAAAIALVDQFNKGLSKLKESGRYKRMVSNRNLIKAIDKLTFLTEENAPLNYKDNGTIKGISVAVVAEILKELESNVYPERFNVQPWARAYKSALQNDNIVLFSMVQTPERTNQFQWVGPIYRANIVLFSNKSDNLKRSSLKAFSKQHICAIREDVGAQIIASLGHPRTLTHLIPTATQCAKMLQLGRVKLWAYGADTGRWYLSKTGADPSQFEEALHLHESYRHIAFSRNVPIQVVNAFQQTLDYLQLSGRLQQIINDELR